MDYFSILNLNKEPFSNSPDPDYFFHSRQHVDCLQKLELSLRFRRGLNVVIGDVGTGKTTLCRQFIRKFKDDTEIETHLILDPYFTTPHEFLMTVTEMLTATKPDPGNDDYQLKEQIKHKLFEKGVDEKKTTVLIIDEGQKIPEFCLEILREFLNYETNAYKLLQIAIFAQKEFGKTLKQHANFTDRINLYHRLDPMSFKDTRRMIQFRLNQSSTAAQNLAFFTYPALWAIFRATRGYPRKIVNLCHRSMLAMIIQNKTKANWFLVQSCLKRAFEGSRKRSWVLAVMLVIVLAAGVVLVPWFMREMDPAIRAAKPETYDIATSQPGEHPGPAVVIRKKGAGPDTGTGQAAKNDSAPAALSEIREPAVVEGDARQTTFVKTAHAAVSPEDARVETPPQPPRPKVLGQLKIIRNETLGGLIQKTYGAFNPQYLDAVIAMNLHIANPDALDVGEVIFFPAIPLNIEPDSRKRWWIELKRRDSMEAAFNILRQQRELASTSRLIPFWDRSSGLHFSIVANRYYDDEALAGEMIDGMAPEMRSESRLLSTWGDETLFYANPYLKLE